ncbi:MAG TPA: glycosyltransferase family 2 protein [Actinomycetota bacterium]|nr:glycosyltransferase family 2 protein [Actinomycetota bacterium]
MRITVAILAKDEHDMIARAVSGARWADEVLVVDGGSRDDTRNIATLAGARVVERPFDDFARQRNFALEQATQEWVFFLDADERFTPELVEELRALDGTHDAYAIPRRSMALGRWLAWHPGGPDAPVRLLRKGSARWSGAVHETVEGAGSFGALRNAIVHLTHRSVSEIVRKIDQYSEFEAAELVRTGARPPAAKAILASFPRAAWQLWRSGLKREGVEGAIETALLAFNRTLVLAKVWERTRKESLRETYARADEALDAPKTEARTQER